MKKAFAILATAAVVGATAISSPAEARWRGGGFGGFGPGLAFGLAAGAITAGIAGAYSPYYYGRGYGYPGYGYGYGAYYGGYPGYYGPRYYRSYGYYPAYYGGYGWGGGPYAWGGGPYYRHRYWRRGYW